MAAVDAAIDPIIHYFLGASFPEENDANLTVSDPGTVKAIITALDREAAKIKSQVEDICVRNSRELETYSALSKTLYDGIQQSEQQVDSLARLSESHEKADDTIYQFTDEYDALTLSHTRNKSYIDALNQIWFVKATLIELRSSFQLGSYVQCVPLLKSAESKITSFPDWERVTILSTLKEEVNSLDSQIFHKLDSLWKQFTRISEDGSELTVYTELREAEHTTVTLEDVSEALKRFDLVGKLKALNARLKTLVLSTILNTVPVTVEVISESNFATLRVSPAESEYTVDKLLDNLSVFVQFINSSFPTYISHSVAVDLVNVFTVQLVDVNLQQSLPLSISEFPKYEDTLTRVKEFDRFLQSQNWTKNSELTDWVKQVPNVWYKKKCDTILIYARNVISEAADSERKMVDKRTAIVSADSLQGAGRAEAWNDEYGDKQRSSNEYDWNEEWDDEDTAETKPSTTDTAAEEDIAEDDGWGFDESLELDDGPENADEQAGSDPDDWNWGDEDSNAKPAVASPAKKAKTAIPRSTPARGSSRAAPIDLDPPTDLGESYVITAVPQKILDLINALLRDSADLATKSTSIAPASRNLRSLISYVLGAFRALAPLHYGDSFDSSLFLHNDCMYLSEQVSVIKDLGADAYLLMEMANRYDAQKDGLF